jgi:predicted O-methyltransferase YrrM
MTGPQNTASPLATPAAAAAAAAAVPSSVMTDQALAVVHVTKGFMPDDEGAALHRAALVAARTGLGPLVEVGAYCGKSSIWLGMAAQAGGTVLFSIDHHRGSEENQAGWEHHDPDVVDSRSGRMDTLPFFRRAVEAAGLEESVLAVVGRSATVARHWQTPLSLLFIDGGHGEDVVRADEQAWVPRVAPDGLVAIHDVFPDPADGGRPPYDLYQRLRAGGSFVDEEMLGHGSLRVLRRKS